MSKLAKFASGSVVGADSVHPDHDFDPAPS
jgi:hypothetical protein